MASFKSTTWIIFAALLVAAPAHAQKKHPAENQGPPAAQEQAAKQTFVGFVDKNNDGVNDRFVDANGDGKNDVDGKPYPHGFKFVDKNRDGINDVWIDRDGDGVNDLSRKLPRELRRQIPFQVLDTDGDGRNDITGEHYDARNAHWMGERWGFWDESQGKLRGRFIDENGDGIDDRLEPGRGTSRQSMMRTHRARMHDIFIDEDGDGICDGRSDIIRRMGRMHKGRRGGGMHRP